MNWNMLSPAGWVVAIAATVLLLLTWNGFRRLKRAQFIRDYAFPPGLFEKLVKRRPQLARKDCALVARGLRQFFLCYHRARGKYVSMPSQAVDDLWHEFILYTKHYERFCRDAFGGFLHHTPAVVLGDDRKGNEGLRRVWWHACREENIDPRDPTRLPLLFALDAKLGIADGFRYAPDCSRLERGAGGTHCAGDFGSSSVDGCTDGFGDGDGGSGGGDGCGGGGCGGGD